MWLSICRIRRKPSARSEGYCNLAGHSYLATPNLSSMLKPLKGERWIGYQDPTHISLHTPEEWKEMIRTCGDENHQGLCGWILGCPLPPWNSRQASKNCSLVRSVDSRPSPAGSFFLPVGGRASFLSAEKCRTSQGIMDEPSVLDYVKAKLKFWEKTDLRLPTLKSLLQTAPQPVDTIFPEKDWNPFKKISRTKVNFPGSQFP